MAEFTKQLPNRPETVEDLYEDERRGHNALSIYRSGLGRHPEFEMAVLQLKVEMKRSGDFDVDGESVHLKLTPEELARRLRGAQDKYDKGAAIYFGPLDEFPEKDKWTTEKIHLDYFLKREGLTWPDPDDLGEFRPARLALAAAEPKSVES